MLEEIKKEFEEITKEVFVTEICDECNGTGDDLEDSSKNCGECYGIGIITKLNPAIWQFIEQKLTEVIKQAKIEENEYWIQQAFDVGALNLPLYSLRSRKPFNWDEKRWQHMVNKPYKERLIIAGALLVAELDRIIYLETNH